MFRRADHVFPRPARRKAVGSRCWRDLDGDGRFDKQYDLSRIRLEWPAGLLCFDGGVFVASPPDLYYFKDHDGDGKADTREVVDHGLRCEQP